MPLKNPYQNFPGMLYAQEHIPGECLLLSGLPFGSLIPVESFQQLWCYLQRLSIMQELRYGHIDIGLLERRFHERTEYIVDPSY